MSRANNRTSNRLHRLTNLRRASNSDSEGRAGKDSTNPRVPLLERDRARIAIIEPSRVIKAIDVAEHCVLCFFQEVIAELVREGAQARHVHNGESEAGDYPVYELDYGGRRLAIVHPGVGASSAAARLEHMIALGCRKFVACGGAGVLVGSISVALAILAPSLTLFVPVFLVSVVALYLYNGPFTAIGQNVVPPSLRASAVTMSLFLAHLLGDSWSPAAVGFLSDKLGSLQTALLITSTPLLLVASFFTFLAFRTIEHDTTAMEDTWAAGKIEALPV